MKDRLKLPEAALYLVSQGNLVPLDPTQQELPTLIPARYAGRICYVPDGCLAAPQNNFWGVTCIRDETLPPQVKARLHKWRIKEGNAERSRVCRTVGSVFDAMLKAHKPLPNSTVEAPGSDSCGEKTDEL